MEQLVHRVILGTPENLEKRVQQEPPVQQEAQVLGDPLDLPESLESLAKSAHVDQPG